jgi:hypothetical protein
MLGVDIVTNWRVEESLHKTIEGLDQVLNGILARVSRREEEAGEFFRGGKDAIPPPYDLLSHEVRSVLTLHDRLACSQANSPAWPQMRLWLG